MVRFFDQKEEVVKIDLTPYGKQQFASGSFMPEYYAFYDNDILYDGFYGGISENQNAIVDRISNSTPRFHPMPRMTSSLNSVVSVGKDLIADSYSTPAPWSVPYMRTLGKSSPWVNFAPAWEIVKSGGDGSLHSEVYYQSENLIPMMSATLDIAYTSTPNPGNEDQKLYFESKSDVIMFDIKEHNTIFQPGGNFDIEVFVSGNDGTLSSLGFVNSEAPHADRLRLQTDAYTLVNTLRGTDNEVGQVFPNLDSNYVEYFLEITVDKEIGERMTPTPSNLYGGPAQGPADICAIRDSGAGENDGTL